MNFLSTETTEEDDLLNKQTTGIRSTCKTIRSIILRRHGEQLVMSHATTFQAQLCNQTQGLALHRQYSEQTLKISYISQHSCDYVMTHKCKGSIVVLSISKSVEPNEEQKEMISGFQ